ncbi:MAG: hypothetical protein P8127_05700, partial [Acidobacteriota bacterium]
LEPSVISLVPGQETVLQVVVRGGSGSYRLPIGIAYDPSRVWVHDVVPAPGAELLRNSIDQAQGWIDLEVVSTSAVEGGQAIAALKLQAIDSGPVPLVLSASEAVTGDGTRVPVAASDGALFVAGEDRDPEER